MKKIHNNLKIENLIKTEYFKELDRLFNSLKKCRRM